MVRNLIAVAVLVIMGIAAFTVFREKPTDPNKTAAPAIKAVPLDRLDTIRIKRVDTEDDKKQAVELELKKEGDTWRMKKPVDYPVNPTAVERMTEALGNLKVVDAIAENQAKHKSLEVDEELGVIVQALAGQDELAHLVIGSSSNNMTFMRLPDKNTVYRVVGYHKSKFRKSIKDLREKKVTGLDKDSIQKITFSNKEGELTLERSGEGEEAGFTPVGTEVKNFKAREADNIARAIVRLNARDFVDEPLAPDKTGLDEKCDRVEVEATAAGKPITLTLLLGNKEGEDTYLKTSASDQLFLISDYSVKRLRSSAKTFEQTDEEVAKEEERKAKREAAKQANQGNPLPAMAGKAGTQTITPEMMKKIQAEMAKQAPPTKQ